MGLDPKEVIKAAIFAAGEPLAVERLQQLFHANDKPSIKQVKQWLEDLMEEFSEGALELRQVGSGYRFQVRADYAEPLSRIVSKRPQKYTRATLETLALIIYKQPITRSEIEQVRGVAVSSHIMKLMLDRDWIHVVGHRDVPGKPALFGTTKAFLDYFNLQSLSDLPPLEDVIDLERVEKELNQQLSLNVDPQNDQLPVPENELVLEKIRNDEEMGTLTDEHEVSEEALAAVAAAIEEEAHLDVLEGEL